MENFSNPRKYPALKAIALLFKIVAILMGSSAITIIIVAIGGNTSENFPGTQMTTPFIVLIAFISGIIVLCLFAVAESIKVLLDIEENTQNANLIAINSDFQKEVISLLKEIEKNLSSENFKGMDKDI